MVELQGIFCTDGVARDNTRFSIGALDEMVWQGSDGGRPSHLSHDMHKFLGWSTVKGLYISHEGSYVLGSTYLPENDNERVSMQNRRRMFLYKFIRDAMDKYKDAFGAELKRHDIPRANKTGKLFYNNIALYGYENILYDTFPNLKEYEDGDGLVLLEVLLKEFEYIGQGVFKSKRSTLAIMLHSYFRRSYSIFNNYNFGFIDQLLEVYNHGNHSIKVRLETDYIGYAPSWIQAHEYEYWYGPRYTDDIANIPEGLTRFESDEIDKVYTNVKSTEFIWKKKDDGRQYQFEMEEVTTDEAPTMEKDTYGCRYLHALYDISKEEFNHFDGAIRSYDLEKIVTRIETPMDKMGHQARYTKIFRLDGQVPLGLWKSLITQYLCSNNSVYDYFGIPRPFQASKQKQREKTLQDYLPYMINKGDGVRLFVSYHPEEQLNEKRCFRQFDELTYSNCKFNSIDFSAVEVAKAMRKIGAEIRLPKEVKITFVGDHIHNVPRIFHAGEGGCFKDVNQTLEGIRLLVAQHVRNNDDEIYTFSLGWNVDGRSVSVSFMGHVEDLHQWLASFTMIPTKRQDFKKWLDTQNTYIHRHGKESPLPSNAAHIINDGMLYLRHRSIINDVEIQEIKCDDAGNIVGQVEMTDAYLAEMWRTGKIFTAPLYEVKDARDEKTGNSYFESPYSYVFRETSYVLDQAHFVTYVWSRCSMDRQVK